MQRQFRRRRPTPLSAGFGGTVPAQRIRRSHRGRPESSRRRIASRQRSVPVRNPACCCRRMIGASCARCAIRSAAAPVVEFFCGAGPNDSDILFGDGRAAPATAARLIVIRRSQSPAITEGPAHAFIPITLPRHRSRGFRAPTSRATESRGVLRAKRLLSDDRPDVAFGSLFAFPTAGLPYDGR